MSHDPKNSLKHFLRRTHWIPADRIRKFIVRLQTVQVIKAENNLYSS